METEQSTGAYEPYHTLSRKGRGWPQSNTLWRYRFARRRPFIDISWVEVLRADLDRLRNRRIVKHGTVESDSLENFGQDIHAHPTQADTAFRQIIPDAPSSKAQPSTVLSREPDSWIRTTTNHRLIVRHKVGAVMSKQSQI
jgi:hypothetical protein